MLFDFSVITVCLNSAATIADTLRSVARQSGVRLQHIIVDGGSTDGTCEIVTRLRPTGSVFTSGQDEGIYDAMNKGLAWAQGEVVAFLNADDTYASRWTLAEVLQVITLADICYGDIDIVDRMLPGLVLRRCRPGDYDKSKFRAGFMPPHPAFFARKRVYDDLGAFDTRMQVAADYDVMLRAFMSGRYSVIYLNKVLVRMKAAGFSSGIKRRLQGAREIRRAWIKLGRQMPPWLLVRRFFSKLAEFIRR